MEAELEQALARIAVVLSARGGNQIGISIPILVAAIIDEEPDDELLELVRTAMSSYDSTVTLPEVAKGVLGLVRWRESAS